jgi:hypothetical protein
MAAEPQHRRPDAPADVVHAALVEPVPCPTCGSEKACRCLPQPDARAKAMAARIVERLTTAGLLQPDPEPAPEPTAADIEQTAQWLVEQSRNPRYTQVPEGWKRLLESSVNVEHAHSSAVKAANPATSQHLANLAAAKQVLLRVVDSRRGVAE